MTTLYYTLENPLRRQISCRVFLPSREREERKTLGFFISINLQMLSILQHHQTFSNMLFHVRAWLSPWKSYTFNSLCETRGLQEVYQALQWMTTCKTLQDITEFLASVGLLARLMKRRNLLAPDALKCVTPVPSGWLECPSALVFNNCKEAQHAGNEISTG